MFQGSDDMYALCLSMLCVANFAAYERKVLAISTKRLGKHLPIEEMTRGEPKHEKGKGEPGGTSCWGHRNAWEVGETKKKMGMTWRFSEVMISSGAF